MSYHLILAHFINEGHFARHIRKMRALYQERQAPLVEAASRELDGLLEMNAVEDGLHLIGWLPDKMNDQFVSRQASKPFRCCRARPFLSGP